MVDDDDFKKAMQGVKPLPESNKHQKPKPKVKTPKRSRQLDIELPPLSITVEPVATETQLEFARSGIQERQLKRMRQGKIQLEAVLDCHHLTQDQTQKALVQFIHMSQQQGYRFVQVVHGKGHHTPKGQISLKSFINTWLRELNQVLAFTSSARESGGTGAVTVLLKKLSD